MLRRESKNHKQPGHPFKMFSQNTFKKQKAYPDQEPKS